MKPHVDTASTPPQNAGGFYDRFRAQLKRDGISAATGEFKDKKVETAYWRFLADTHLSTERLYWWGTIVTYFLYLILDVTTITQALHEIIAMRFIVGGGCAAAISLSYIDRFKRHFAWLTAGGMLAFALSIIAMISMMQADHAPPYIIGILVTYIASSCLMRMPFRLALGVYGIGSLAYIAVLNFDPDFPRWEIISGHFFIISIAIIAIATNYAQEIRSRMIWLRDAQRQRDQETIEKLLIEATAADQSKINFLSMMSHELRTPLHQIIGYAEVVSNAVKTGGDRSVKLQHLDEIHGSAHVLLSRIQKMLRFADATAGKMKYEIVDTPVSELVDVALEQTRGGFEKKSLRADTSGLQSGVIDIDIVHTCYALNNILENAINASKEDGVIHIGGAKTEDGGYDLTIRDEGAGMTPDQVARALKPFTQGENALVRAREGLGLGLTLAKHIFNDQQAVIALSSRVNEGTTVTIKFPASARAAAPVKQKAAG
ncbi:MAG: HAMP domain-containing sensor histidine kinase [Parvularculaceae bacterium]